MLIFVATTTLGRTITTQEIYNNTHKFDLSNKSKGIYFIEFKNEEETKVSKILVE